MGSTYLQLNLPTIITISLCGLLGYGLLVGASMLAKKLTGQ